MELFKHTLFKHEVPVLFREPHVEGGYRRLHQPWRYYMASIFQRHNECMNTWTHLIAVAACVLKLYDFSKRYDLIGDPYLWPLLLFMITMLLLFTCSAGAHCLQSRSDIVHYTCFMVDYAGIGIYGLGAIQLHYAFCIDPALFSLLNSVYLPVGTVLAILTCVCCSISKTIYVNHCHSKTLWKILSVASIYSLAILPIIHRICGSFLSNQWDEIMLQHVQHILLFLLGGFFFGSDIPQRFYPGKFDIFGHSHQLFHVCVMLTSLKQLDAFVLDYNQYRDQIYARPTPTFLSTFGAVIFVCFANVVVVLSFRAYVKRFVVEDKRKTNDTATQNGFNNNHIKCH